MDKYRELRAKYRKAYFEVALPVLKKYEEERKKKLKIVNKIKIIGIICFCMIIFRPIGFFIAVFGLIITCAIRKNIKENFEIDVKNELMPKLCQCFGNFGYGRGVYSIREELYTGIQEGVPIEIYYDNSDIINALHGYVTVKLEMNKSFKGNTIIKRDSFFHIPSSLELKHTVLEDVEFEKKFDVFCDDEVEARYLITPAFMERLNNIQVAFSAKSVSCAFYKNYLLIALGTNKDLFSLCSLDKPLDDVSQYTTMCEEIISILALIDYFKLNEQTGI